MARFATAIAATTLIVSFADVALAQDAPKPKAAPSELPTFTEEQIKTIREAAAQIGYSKRRVGDVLVAPDEPIRALWTGKRFDVQRKYIDLMMGSLSLDDSGLHISIRPCDVFPDSGDLDLRFEVRCDTDDSHTTGESRGSMKGIDRLVMIRLRGHYPFSGDAGSASAEVLNSDVEIAPPTLFPVRRFASDPTGCTSSIVAYVVSVTVPAKALVPLSRRVPFQVAAAEWVGDRVVESDECEPTVLETVRPPRTTLTTSPLDAQPGDTIRATGVHFLPNGSVKIVQDNEDQHPLVVATTNADGAFSTSFTVPDLAVGTYTINAGGGRAFDFSLLTVKPRLNVEPPTAGSTKRLLVLSGCRARTRYQFYVTTATVPGDLEAGSLPSFATEHALPESWGVVIADAAGTIGEDGVARASVSVPQPFVGRPFFAIAFTKDPREPDELWSNVVTVTP
ncbi:MAG: hypothetical protein HYR85_23620 [Planctomycetes bacterium]|nr:hypothetical protein [Planctomycetota bacterium]MBI3844046.1 hypothetical protein [Planctomycetota bacterium]